MTGPIRSIAGPTLLFSLAALLFAIASSAFAQTVSDGTFLDANWALTMAALALVIALIGFALTRRAR